MSEEKHSVGPWKRARKRGWSGIETASGEDLLLYADCCGDWHGRVVCDNEADWDLILAAPAYAVVWSLVPENVKQQIFDTLHKKDTAWIEAAISKAGAP